MPSCDNTEFMWVGRGGPPWLSREATVSTVHSVLRPRTTTYFLRPQVSSAGERWACPVLFLSTQKAGRYQQGPPGHQPLSQGTCTGKCPRQVLKSPPPKGPTGSYRGKPLSLSLFPPSSQQSSTNTWRQGGKGRQTTSPTPALWHATALEEKGRPHHLKAVLSLATSRVWLIPALER